MNETREEEKLKISAEKIQNFVKNEILAEQKYQRENEAKFRAIEQRVPTYEDFRQIVLASHLKPLDKGESLRNSLTSRTSNKAWNTAASLNNGQKSDQNDFGHSLELEKESLIRSEPRSSLEFMKIWRLIDTNYGQDEADCDRVKWSFLNNFNAEKCLQIFKAEISGEMLGKFLLLFNRILTSSNLGQSSLEFISDMLKAFAKCNRFALNLMFLKQNELDACKRILNTLSDNNLNVNELEKSYLK